MKPTRKAGVWPKNPVNWICPPSHSDNRPSLRTAAGRPFTGRRDDFNDWKIGFHQSAHRTEPFLPMRQ